MEPPRPDAPAAPHGPTPPWFEGELPEVDRTRPPWPGRRHVVDGIPLHVRETPGPAGSDGLAVYVHGLSGSAQNWTDLAALLATRMPGLAPDLPGFGRSQPTADYDYRLETTADLLARLVADQGRGPAHLLGNSMGGAIALLVAARAPELVRTLTLVSPAMPDLRLDPRRTSDPRLLLAFLPVVGARIRRRLATVTPRERAEQMIQLCFAHPELVPQQRIAEAADEIAERSRTGWALEALGRTSAGMVRTWLAPPSRSLWTTARSVTAPTLVVWGTEDKLVSLRKAPRLAAALPRARLLVLRDTGHVAQLEHPEQVARAVLGMHDAVAESRW